MVYSNAVIFYIHVRKEGEDMNDNIKKTIDLILDNKESFRRQMLWEVDSNTYAIIGGILTASKEIEANPELYKECKKILRKNISGFSEIRGVIGAIVAVKMMMVEDKIAYVQGIETVYKKLRSLHKFTASPYMVLAAINIYESRGIEGADEEIDKLESLYKGLKEKHPFLVTDEDRGYLSMLINANINVEKALDDIEDNFVACKDLTFSKDTAYSLAQVLALSKESPEVNHDMVKKIMDGLKANKKRIDKSFGLTVLGALTLLGVDEDQLIQDIIETDEYIKGQRGFKWYNQSMGLRITYAALFVFLAYSKVSGISQTLSTNIAVVIAEQIMTLIIIMLCTVNTTRSSSSN